MPNLLTRGEIAKLCQDGVIEGGSPQRVSAANIASYGVGFCGYDIRLSDRVLVHKCCGNMFVAETQILSEPDNKFVMVLRVASECRWHIVDPLNLVGKGKYEAMTVPEGGLLLEPGTHVIGYSVERFNMPGDLFALIFGKSTYARHGLLVNATPIEPGWQGYLALGLCNVSNSPILVRPSQGIAQVVFFRVSENLKYDGKHQGQQMPGVMPDKLEAEIVHESLLHGPQV